MKMTELDHRARRACAPAPTTWAHHAACAWTAAWLTARGRTMLGPRELLTSAEWLAEVQWIERHGVRRRGHRPDLVGGVGAGGPLLPIEVELAVKSAQRLRAILGSARGVDHRRQGPGGDLRLRDRRRRRSASP